MLECDADIILLYETWRQNDILDSELFTDNFSVIRKDRNLLKTGKTTGGGILAAVSCDWNFKEIDMSETEISQCIEIMCVQIFSERISIYIILVYIPPAAHIQDYMSFYVACHLV